MRCIDSLLGRYQISSLDPARAEDESGIAGGAQDGSQFVTTSILAAVDVPVVDIGRRASDGEAGAGGLVAAPVGPVTIVIGHAT